MSDARTVARLLSGVTAAILLPGAAARHVHGHRATAQQITDAVDSVARRRQDQAPLSPSR